MKKIIALLAILFSVLVPVQAQADTKSLVIIDSYFQSNVVLNPITPSGTPCPQTTPISGASASTPYNHGTAMYAVAKLQNPALNIIAICGANAKTEMTPAQFISSLQWVENNASKIKAVSFSRYFNHATKPCMPTASAPWTPETADKEIKRIITVLKQKNILVFASTGNETNKPVNYPACIVDTVSVVHANEVGNTLGQFDANTDYFVKISDDGSKFNYSTSIGLVAHTSSSATAAIAAMWSSDVFISKIVKAKA